MRSDGTNADAMFVRGLCLYYEDYVDKAFSHFQQVLRLAPDHQLAKDTYKVKIMLLMIFLKVELFFPPGLLTFKSDIAVISRVSKLNRTKTGTVIRI